MADNNRGKAGKKTEAEHLKELKDTFYNERVATELDAQKSKRTFFNKISTDENGNITSSSEVAFSKLPVEPNFIKLYLQDVVVLKGLQQSAHSLLHELLKLVKYEEYIFSLSSYDKEQIASKLGFKDPQQVANGIGKLKKAGIIFAVRKEDGKIARGTFEINSFLFGKGGWAENFNARSYNKLSVLYGCGERTVINEDAILEQATHEPFFEEPTKEDLEMTIQKAQELLNKLNDKGEE